jgi:hypothetical protein
LRAVRITLRGFASSKPVVRALGRLQLLLKRHGDEADEKHLANSACSACRKHTGRHRVGRVAACSLCPDG